MDKAYFPYGNKTKEFLIKRTLYLCNYLFSKGIDKIILACNTISYIALPFLKEIFQDRIEGVFTLLVPYMSSDSLLICSSALYKALIENNYPYPILDCQQEINQIEEGININLDRINDLNSNYSILLLGCTHFIKVKDNFKFKNYIV